MKGRKTKTVKSAKNAGFKPLKKSPEFLRNGHCEWMRVLTPPRSDSPSADEQNQGDSEDELIRRYFSGLSSGGSSISWAEDAVESEFTNKLMKLWEDIEMVCAGGSRPEKMSNIVYDECMQWQKAFPNPNLHRFSKSDDIEADLSSVESPTNDGNAAFSPRSSSRGSKLIDEPIKKGQLDFRSLNCSTPRPNIEKSTEYVSAWLSGCQTAYVPEKDQHSSDYRNSKSLSPLLPAINSTDHCDDKDFNIPKSSFRHGARSSYTHSRTHSKFVNEPDPSNFFTSLAITNNENYGNTREKRSTSFAEAPAATGKDEFGNIPFGLPRFTSFNGYRNKINESDEDDDDYDACETLSFRPNVRVQRPISSRIRDHAITPIATGSHVQTYFGPSLYKHNNTMNMNTNNQLSGPSNSITNSFGTELYRPGGRARIFESFNGSAIPSSAKADFGSSANRIKSGIGRQSHVMTSQFSRNKQQPWSRHSGEVGAGATPEI